MKKELLLNHKIIQARNFMTCLLIIVLMGGYTAKAITIQTPVEILMMQNKVSINVKSKPIIAILSEIEKQANIGFIVKDIDDVEELKELTLNVNNMSVKDALNQLLKSTNYTYSIVNNTINIEKKAPVKSSQQTTVKVKGRVTDDAKRPMPGVTILIKNTTKGAITDEKGDFVIVANIGDELEFTFIGCQTEIRKITKDTKDILVILKNEAVAVDDVVVTAFGQKQRRESLIGSVSTVNAKQLKSSSSDLTTSFAGNIAGMIAWQTGGIPGALTEDEMNTKFYIRGITSFQSGANIDPLILLDGVESSKLDLARIDPEDIESFSVLKDASATAMYGARGANGVIYVTTKKGQSGSVYTTARYEVVSSMPTEDIDVVDPIRYMELYNEAIIGRNPNATPKYTRERIKNTSNSKIPSFVNPANDWYGTMFKDMSINHRLSVNVRGGSDIVQYYASVNYNQDNGMLKTDKLNEFDVNIKNQGFTFRTNLNIDLNKGIKMIMNSFSTLDKYHGPMVDVRNAYYMAFRANPVDFAVMYPSDDYYTWNHIRFGGLKTDYNPYKEIHQGYTDRMRYSTINRFEYIQDLSFIAKGLEFRGNASLSQEGLFSTQFSTIPFLYTLKSYDYVTGKHELFPQNQDDASRVLNSQPSNVSSSATTRMGFDVRLMHSSSWGNHQTSALVLFNIQENRTSIANTLFNSLPKRNLGLAATATYGYKDKYFFQGSFGYNGSERFEKKKRMGFFPSLGGSWVISKEGFMKPLSKAITFAKLRFSWGEVGNDGIIRDPRFVHLSTITKHMIDPIRPTNSNLFAYTINNYANPDVTWEIAEQLNLGLDLKLIKGIVELNVDAYKEIRHNVLDLRTTIPVSVGLYEAAFDNIGKVDSRGVDLSLKVQHAFTSDLWVILNGTFTYNKAKFLEIEEATNKPEWQRKKGREISQSYGYIAEGLFTDYEEIENSPFQGGDVMPGDIRYRDINNDKKIDTYDAVPIGFPETPRIIYGFNAFVNYKNFELNFAFQGLGNRTFFINPKNISPFEGNRAVLKAIDEDHWTPNNMSNKPFWPRLSSKNIIEHNTHENYEANAEVKKSTYFMNSGQFLRCKSIELGYNIPNRLVKKIKLRNVKVYARTNNPFVISSFNVWDIELGGDGFNYPIQRTYSVGLNISF